MIDLPATIRAKTPDAFMPDRDGNQRKAVIDDFARLVERAGSETAKQKTMGKPPEMVPRVGRCLPAPVSLSVPVNEPEPDQPSMWDSAPSGEIVPVVSPPRSEPLAPSLLETEHRADLVMDGTEQGSTLAPAPAAPPFVALASGLVELAGGSGALAVSVAKAVPAVSPFPIAAAVLLPGEAVAPLGMGAEPVGGVSSTQPGTLPVGERVVLDTDPSPISTNAPTTPAACPAESHDTGPAPAPPAIKSAVASVAAPVVHPVSQPVLPVATFAAPALQPASLNAAPSAIAAPVPAEANGSGAIPKVVRITLRPAELGPVQVVVHTGADATSVRIVAETEAGYSALLARSEVLAGLVRDLRAASVLPPPDAQDQSFKTSDLAPERGQERTGERGLADGQGARNAAPDGRSWGAPGHDRAKEPVRPFGTAGEGNDQHPDASVDEAAGRYTTPRYRTI